MLCCLGGRGVSGDRATLDEADWKREAVRREQVVREQVAVVVETALA